MEFKQYLCMLLGVDEFMSSRVIVHGQAVWPLPSATDAYQILIMTELDELSTSSATDNENDSDNESHESWVSS